MLSEFKALIVVSAGGVGHAHAEDNIPPPPGVQVTNGVVAKHQDGDVEVASNYAQEIAIEKVHACFCP